MLNQNDVKGKIQVLKGGVKNFLHKIHAKTDKNATDQADGIVDEANYTSVNDMNEYAPGTDKEAVGTAPRTKLASDAQDLVWDNEDASMQDKSYAFDEDTTDADYDLEDDLDFQDDSSESGQDSRYS